MFGWLKKHPWLLPLAAIAGPAIAPALGIGGAAAGGAAVGSGATVGGLGAATTGAALAGSGAGMAAAAGPMAGFLGGAAGSAALPAAFGAESAMNLSPLVSGAGNGGFRALMASHPGWSSAITKAGKYGAGQIAANAMAPQQPPPPPPSSQERMQQQQGFQQPQQMQPFGAGNVDPEAAAQLARLRAYFESGYGGLQ